MCRRHRLGHPRHPRDVERARRQHHGLAAPHVLVRDDIVAVVGAAHGDTGMRPERRRHDVA